MFNENTGILEEPYNIASLSKATGNPMLDVGYQCCDSRPYFKYSNGSKDYYTTVHPVNLVSKKINVYEKTTKNVDGIDYDAMSYVGSTTDTNTQSIVYEGVTYNYQNSHINIRGFYINKWAKYKSIIFDRHSYLVQSEDLDKDEFVKADCGFEIQRIPVPTSGATDYSELIESMLNDLNNSKFKWAYAPPSKENNNWFRQTDFIGYNRKAENPFYLDIFNRIGPTINGVRDIYCETQEDTYDININIGEYPKDVLPENNVTTECLPTYFKEQHAIGLVYSRNLYGNVSYDYVDPYNVSEGGNNDFLYPITPNESLEIPLNVRIGATYNIGAFLINKDSGDTGYYFPVKPLNVRFLRIPNIVNFEYNYYADGADFILEMKVTRNGNTWWWGTHRPETKITGARLTTKYPPYSDMAIEMYVQKQNSNTWEVASGTPGDSVAMRYAIKDNIRYEWNGYVNPSTDITNPINAIPALSNVESITFYFTFEQMKKSEYINNETEKPGFYKDMIIESSLTLDTEDGVKSYTISFGREAFETLGWLDPINNN